MNIIIMQFKIALIIVLLEACCIFPCKHQCGKGATQFFEREICRQLKREFKSQLKCQERQICRQLKREFKSQLKRQERQICRQLKREFKSQLKRHICLGRYNNGVLNRRAEDRQEWRVWLHGTCRKSLMTAHWRRRMH